MFPSTPRVHLVDIVSYFKHVFALFSERATFSTMKPKNFCTALGCERLALGAGRACYEHRRGGYTKTKHNSPWLVADKTAEVPKPIGLDLLAVVEGQIARCIQYTPRNADAAASMARCVRELVEEARLIRRNLQESTEINELRAQLAAIKADLTRNASPASPQAPQEAQATDEVDDDEVDDRLA